MKSMATGDGMARMRSAMNTAAPLRTPTSRGTLPACSRAMARPSSVTRAAISSRAMSTPPGRRGMESAPALLGRDECGDRPLTAHSLGHALGFSLALEGADADAVVRLAVSPRGRHDVGVEAHQLELLLERVGLRLRLEGRRLHRPWAHRLRGGAGGLVTRRGRVGGGRLLDDGLSAARVGIGRRMRI